MIYLEYVTWLFCASGLIFKLVLCCCFDVLLVFVLRQDENCWLLTSSNHKTSAVCSQSKHRQGTPAAPVPNLCALPPRHFISFALFLFRSIQVFFFFFATPTSAFQTLFFLNCLQHLLTFSEGKQSTSNHTQPLSFSAWNHYMFFLLFLTRLKIGAMHCQFLMLVICVFLEKHFLFSERKLKKTIFIRNYLKFFRW